MKKRGRKQNDMKAARRGAASNERRPMQANRSSSKIGVVEEIRCQPSIENR